MKNNKTPVQISLGSLFDGIGGFPYAASFYGIKTLWASEIIPAAISVTRRHFPDMEHVGDITRLKGGELAPVDIITFGSPCQSFSIAGKRTGLEGKSGLFWEAIRIIKEMREATNGQYPRYCVLENVPGILSANLGRDYQTVLEALTETEIPFPPSGRWTNAGMVRGGRIDVAWVIHDAQYFGVAQRRRRLFAVCDFTKQRAAEILFKPKSVYGHFASSGEAGKRIAADAQRSVDGSSANSLTLSDKKGVPTAKVYGICAEGSNSMKSANPHSGIYEADTSRTIDQNCGNPSCNQGGMAIVTHDLDGVNIEKCVAAFMGGQSGAAGSIAYNEKLSPTLKSGSGGNMVPCICKPQSLIAVLNDQGGDSLTVEKTEISPTLRSETHGNLPIVGMNRDIADTLDIPNVLGVNQNAGGDVRTAETAYSLTTSSNASGRNAPLVCHPDVVGTLCGSGAGLSRPAGMCSETDLCIVTKEHHDLKLDVCGTLLKKDSAGTSDVVAYCLQGNMIGREDKNGPQGSGVNEEVAFTLNTIDKHCVAAVFSRQRSDLFKPNDLTSTQTARQSKDATDLVCMKSSAVDCRNLTESEEISGTLQAKSTGSYSLNYQNPIRRGFIVRRLTPTEAERLQGYPDGWTEYGHDGKPLCDTARYQALGNSVAIPCVAYVLSGIVDEFYNE